MATPIHLGSVSPSPLAITVGRKTGNAEKDQPEQVRGGGQYKTQRTNGRQISHGVISNQ